MLFQLNTFGMDALRVCIQDSLAPPQTGEDGLITLEMAEIASGAVRNSRGIGRDTKKVNWRHFYIFQQLVTMVMCCGLCPVEVKWLVEVISMLTIWRMMWQLV